MARSSGCSMARKYTDETSGALAPDNTGGIFPFAWIVGCSDSKSQAAGMEPAQCGGQMVASLRPKQQPGIPLNFHLRTTGRFQPRQKGREPGVCMAVCQTELRVGANLPLLVAPGLLPAGG